MDLNVHPIAVSDRRETSLPWLPRFACPECHTELWGSLPLYRCPRCARTYELSHGIWRFLTRDRAIGHLPFLDQYRKVRQADGHRRTSPDFYLSLPYVASDDRQVVEWRIRAETYRHLNANVLASAPHALRVLDLGAGSGWLSNRLSELRHRPVAVDILDDEVDGLRAIRTKRLPFIAVQADFDALPFAPSQFDLVIFNASLHYGREPVEALRLAHSMLAPAGALVVMDSPMFVRDRDGAAMADRLADRFAKDHGLGAVVSPGPGYLTFESLNRTAARLGLHSEFTPSLGSWRWRIGRTLTTLSRRRVAASFGLWVAR